MHTPSSQFLAADPHVSTWLSASAGSGKTKVLIDRFVRLLIAGEQFSSILCFTYTNAGAIEIKQRLQLRLQEMSESENLQEILSALLQRPPTDNEVQRAKTLFFLSLRNPQSIQIQTIHSFCKDFLLQQFGVIGDNEILNQAEATKVLTQAQMLYCNECIPSGKSFFKSFLQRSNDHDCAQVACISNLYQVASKNHTPENIAQSNQRSPSDYEYLLSLMTFEQIDGTLSALLSKRYDFAQFLKKYDSAQFTKMIEKEIGIPEFTTPFNPHATQQIAKNIGSPDNATIQLILAGNYELAFLTTTQTLRKKLVGLTRSELYPVLYAQAENFFYEVQRKNADEFIQKNKAFINIANTVLQGYQRIKAKNNQYDFDDLIMKTCEVLTNASDSRYLKDAISLGIKHVFIDEAQDTTPQQWQIVLHIVSLFFERDCTLFVVGDAKQSIFGFQGAKPWMFTTLQEVFERLITQMGGTFQRLELNTSYRSVPEVLSLVDRIFENDSRFLNYACHIPARQDRGFVKCVTVSDADLCPPSKSSEFLYGQNFDNDENVMSATDAIIFKTALIVADLLARQTFCPCVNRNAIPSDVLVLSRKRRNLYKIAGKLFDLGIPCESPQNIVWLDLLAFVTFLIDPHDDYNLACLLKSPFLQDCVVSEEQLSSLCCSRQTVDLEGLRKCSLWSEILKKSDASNSHCPAEEECNFDQDEAANIRNILVEYQTEAANIKNNDDFYNFFHRTLFQVQPYFASYYVTSIFDVFLSEVLSFLSENMPDLAAFLEFIQRCFPQSKFQNEGVQLKTIHGAKGLQSPIVVLTDISIIPREKWIWLDDDDFGAPRGVMLMPSGALARHLREQKLACSNDEEARLLYVAITRAQDGFIIVGRDGDWHSAVKNASS